MKVPNDNRRRNIAIYTVSSEGDSIDVKCVEEVKGTRSELPEEIMTVGPEGVTVFEKTDMELPEWMSASHDEKKFQIVYKFKTRSYRTVFAHEMPYKGTGF